MQVQVGKKSILEEIHVKTNKSIMLRGTNVLSAVSRFQYRLVVF